MDHIDHAVYATVHESDIPAKEISSRLGMSHQTLINKANPQSEFHKLTLREAVAIQMITNSRRILRAMDVELGKAETNKIQPGNHRLISAILTASSEHGDIVRAVNDALKDGRFTPREKEACQKEIDDAVLSLSVLREAIVTYQ